MPTPILSAHSDYTWQNWHKTGGVGGKVKHFYSPRNRWTTGQGAAKRWLPGLEALCQIVLGAEAAGERVRCVGSGWSLSNVAFTDQRLVNTARLTNYFVGFRSDSMVVDAYVPKKNRLVFAQCGTQIVTLNNVLERAQPERLALPTSGASNGQTVVGATQTGTHGSAHEYGPMQNCIRALHVVAEGGKHYLLQSASNPVVTLDFAEYLGAELWTSEEIFQAAVVGLGSFGLIHAVLLEATPMYGLGRYVEQFDFDEVERAICDFDPSGLGLPTGDDLPWHFEVVVNPYRRGAGEKGAFVRTYQKFEIAPDDPLPRIPVVDGEPMNSEDLVTLGGVLTSVSPSLIPGALQAELVSSLAPTAGQTIRGTPGGQFTDSQPTNGGTSMELGVAATQVSSTLKELLSVADRFSFPAPLAFRWVKGSDQTLSFSRFAPVTCHIEVPGIDSARTREAYRMMWQALDQAGVEYTCHWGQALPRDPAWVKRAFGGARVERWKAARREFLSERARWTFSSELLDRYGLGD